MTKEMAIILRDDLDGKTGLDVATREFGWAGTDYEIELTDDHYLEFQQTIARYLKVARAIKRKGRQRKSSVPTVAEPKSGSWAREISQWATSRGYDWHDKSVRDAVRQWAIDSGMKCPKVGIVPREVMEAFHAANSKSPAKVGKS